MSFQEILQHQAMTDALAKQNIIERSYQKLWFLFQLGNLIVNISFPDNTLTADLHLPVPNQLLRLSINLHHQLMGRR